MEKMFQKASLEKCRGNRYTVCVKNKNRECEIMYVIAGLGNPTKQYENTRHNAGFCVIDYLSEKYQIPVKQAGYKALYGSGYIEGQKVIL